MNLKILIWQPPGQNRVFSLNVFTVAARVASLEVKPLTPDEEKLMGRVNVFIMDWEADGGHLPPDLQKIFDKPDFHYTPDEARKLIAWFNRTAPGSYTAW